MSTPPEGIEDRRTPGDAGKRYGVNWEIRAGHTGPKMIPGRLMNVSVAGVLMQVPAPYNIGHLVEIEVRPDEGARFGAEIKIIREHARTEDAFYYGCLIVRQSDEARAAYTSALLDLRRKEMYSEFGRDLTGARPRPRKTG